MELFDVATFGDLNAADYDETQNPATTQQTVDFIYDLMGGAGHALELAIGTGRIAVPLATRGITVSGVEGSQKMVDIMRQKPGGADIACVIGDMADVAIEGPFDHAYLVFNTLFNLLTQDAQLRCFANTAKQLKPGGTFMIETFVPRFDDYVQNQFMKTRTMDRDHVMFETIMHDSVAQRLDFQRIWATQSGMKLVPFMMRYAYPPELDLMAQLAGLTLRDRFGGWNGEPFTDKSELHVTVYEKPMT